MTLADTETLSVQERSKLDQLEAVIDADLKAFIRVGNALMEIRESRLYRSAFSTFEDYCRERWNMTRRQANRLIGAVQVVSNLGPIGPTPANESQARPLAELEPDQQREAWQAAVETAQEGKVTAEHVERVVEAVKETGSVEEAKAKLAVHFSSDSPEWYTPKEILDKVEVALGSIDLDPCSNSGNPNVPAARHFAQQQNGLAREWCGRVYMNPPYGREIAEWVSKLVEEFRAGRTTQAIALLPARTDTEWFRLLREFPRCFVFGRLNFSGHENSAPFPSVLVYLGKSEKKFAKVFAEVGDTYSLTA